MEIDNVVKLCETSRYSSDPLEKALSHRKRQKSGFENHSTYMQKVAKRGISNTRISLTLTACGVMSYQCTQMHATSFSDRDNKTFNVIIKSVIKNRTVQTPGEG